MDFSKERSLTYLRAVAQAQHDELVRLRQELADARQQLGLSAAVADENTRLKELLGQREHALFGRSSERRGKGHPAAKTERTAQTGHGPREQPDIERETIVHELPADARTCSCCGGELVEMGSEVESSELVGVRERGFVLETHERKKYRCGCNGEVKTAPGPVKLLAKGRYSLSFAVEVAIAKYADHLPLERQAQIMKRDGLRIDSQTLWDQLDALAVHLGPTYEAIISAILALPVIHADETRWLLLDNGKTKENKTFQAWGLVAPELVAYRILDSRGKEAARSIFGEYEGVVMADGYTVYKSLAADTGTFLVANCWAHVRRKFVECEGNFPAEAGAALDFIRQLYAVEREATPANRLTLRRERSAPIAQAIFAWAREMKPKVLPRSGIGEAIGYLLNLEEGLRRFLEDARIPLDNNASERALRGVVLGRKNHYGSRSRRGTEVAAMLYTLMESAKLAGVSPRAYLTAVAELAIRTPGATLTPESFKSQQVEKPA
ncbi:Transposase IS66 family protein [compost metagenome]